MSLGLGVALTAGSGLAYADRADDAPGRAGGSDSTSADHRSDNHSGSDNQSGTASPPDRRKRVGVSTGTDAGVPRSRTPAAFPPGPPRTSSAITRRTDGAEPKYNPERAATTNVSPAEEAAAEEPRPHGAGFTPSIAEATTISVNPPAAAAIPAPAVTAAVTAADIPVLRLGSGAARSAVPQTIAQSVVPPSPPDSALQATERTLQAALHAFGIAPPDPLAPVGHPLLDFTWGLFRRTESGHSARARVGAALSGPAAAQVTPRISIADVSVTEGNSGATTANFTVTLSGSTTAPVTVRYATAGGTATAGSDFTAASGTLTFAAGATKQTIAVKVNGDTVVEPAETFTVTLSNPSGATISRASATGTITNDDSPSQSGVPAVPFGSHLRPYAAGTLIPTGSRATLDAAVVTLYNKWKSNFLVSAGSYGLAVKANADYPYISEGQGYGMELTALMAGADPSAKTSFDGILKYVLAHPSSINPNLHAAEQNSSFASVNGSNSATDGDMSIAYALLLADKQWGSTGTYNYKQLAVTRINAIKASEMNPGTHLPTLGDWDTPGDPYYNSTRPSDFMVDHFRAFKAATNDPFWDAAVGATQGLITQQQNAYAPTTGLIADFVVNTNSTAKPAPANFLEGSTDGQYSYNSVRVPWHIGTDAAVSGDATSKAQAQKITSWFRTKTGGNPSRIVSGYKLDGTSVVNYLDPEFVATLGPAAMGNPANQAWLDSIWNYTVTQSQGSAANSYYTASLMLQSMLVMSGNYWAP